LYFSTAVSSPRFLDSMMQKARSFRLLNRSLPVGRGHRPYTEEGSGRPG
jgi:hypothetical protein